MEDTENQQFCPNCKAEIFEYQHFCGNCGQKNRALKVKIWEFFSEFIDTLFNIDNRFFKTLYHVIIPAKLTNAYFRGERQKYYHPLRIYLVVIILFFALLSFLGVDNIIDVIGERGDLSEVFEKRGLIKDNKEKLASTLDSLKNLDKFAGYEEVFDSIDAKVYFEIDSQRIYLRDTLSEGTTNLQLFTEEVKLTNDDFFVTDIDSVIHEANLNNWVNELILRQIIKGSRDIGSLNNFIYANLSWLLIALIPLFAIILKLFYLRRGRYYLEHYVFLLHMFSGVLLISLIFLSLGQEEELKDYAVAAMGITAIVFPFMAFKKYYKQGFFKTFIKFCLIGLFFFISFILTFSIFILITAALF
jgi:hypothetical protein